MREYVCESYSWFNKRTTGDMINYYIIKRIRGDTDLYTNLKLYNHTILDPWISLGPEHIAVVNAIDSVRHV